MAIPPNSVIAPPVGSTPTPPWGIGTFRTETDREVRAVGH
jgi:hypothetical protein